MNEVADIIAFHLKILFVGYNPGARSAEIGHHFAGHSNRFWKLLHQSGITPYQIKPEDDRSLLRFGCGITNIVARPSRTAAEITKEEYQAGRMILKQKLDHFKPRIACYAGIGIYKEFSEKKHVTCGLQAINMVDYVTDFVVPSPSGLNRMIFHEQLRYYQSLQEMAQQID